MALLSGITIGSEVGLQLLLSPKFSSTAARTACKIVGVGLPVYSSFKAIETKNETEKEEWLIYWSAYGCFSVAEIFSDKLLSWCPFYYHAKLAFLVWLQIPNNWGAKHVYAQYVRPGLVKHQGKIDRVVTRGRREMAKFLKQNENELRAAGLLIHRTATSVFNTLHTSFTSSPPPPTNASPLPKPRTPTASLSLNSLTAALPEPDKPPGSTTGLAASMGCGEQGPVLPMLSIPDAEERNRTEGMVEDSSEVEVTSPIGWFTVDPPSETNPDRGN